jgi:cerevisin
MVTGKFTKQKKNTNLLNDDVFSSHCAGTIGGKKYGVAKKSIPVAVKVLASNGSGSMSDVVKGVDWATNSFLKDKKDAEKAGKPFKGSAANMSLGGGKSPSLDATVNGAVDAGLVFAVAAGNDNKDAW